MKKLKLTSKVTRDDKDTPHTVPVIVNWENVTCMVPDISGTTMDKLKVNGTVIHFLDGEMKYITVTETVETLDFLLGNNKA